MTITLPGLLILLVIAWVCGAVGKALAGGARGGLITSIVVGFIGALVGPWIAGQLGLTGINWGEAKVGNIGPNSLPSRMGDGSATLGGDPAYVWYATINPGGAQQVLVVYAVNNRIGKFHQPNADAAVKTIRKM